MQRCMMQKSWGFVEDWRVYVVTSLTIGSASSIHICRDNFNVAQAGTPNGSSQNGFRKFKQIAENWLSIEGIVSVQWTPNHMAIRDNDIADGEAKRCAGKPSTVSTTEKVHTLAYAHQINRKTNEWKKGGRSQAFKATTSWDLHQ